VPFIRTGSGRLLIGLSALVATVFSQATAAAPAITAFALNPSTVAGGSGSTSTATVTLSEPSPAGGSVVTISSSNTDLAASVPSITVPAGATTATFTIVTNALYRRYSGLGFTVTISVTIPSTASTRSAILTVTSQARPPDITGPDSDMSGLICGGALPDNAVLLQCVKGPNTFTPGPCSFVQECPLGCQDLPDQGTTLNAACATTPPFPVSLKPTYVVGGGSVDGASSLPEPAPANAHGFVQSFSPFAIASSPTNFAFPTGATSTGFTLSTQAVGVPSFVPLAAQNVVPEPSPGGGTFFAARSGLAWVALAPRGNAPHPRVTSLALDSPSISECSATQGTVTLSPAPAGAVQVLLASSRPDVVSIPTELPFSVIVPAGATTASFTVNGPEVASSTTVTLSATLTGLTQTAPLTITNANGPSPSSLTLNPSTVVGGSSSIGMVTLSGPAPAGGVVVSLFSYAPVTVPPSVTVPAGQVSASFTISTAPVTFGTVVGITAAVGCLVAQASLMVTTPPPDPVLASLAVSPTSVTGGASSTGTATLTAAAPAGGKTVTLSSANPAIAAVPGSVTIAAGAASASFSVTTTAVTSSTVVTLSGSSGGATQTVTLTVTPAGGGGGGTPGFNSPTANAPDSGGDGNGFESSPSSAYAVDGSVAADMNSGTGTGTSCTSTGKDRHRFFNYGFAIPSGSSIAGIEVRLDARAESTSGAPKICVQLSWDGGTTWTAAKATGTLGTSLGAFTLGSASDTWGRTWSAANFTDTSFRVRVINVSSSTSRDFFLDRVGVHPYVTAAGPASLSAISVNPATIVGGNASTATVTLTASAPSGGTVVSLVSGNTAVATVPASVTVAVGATSATFPVTTAAVGTSTSVTLSATSSGVTRTATLEVNPQAGDTVAIQRAEYKERDDELRVEATSTSATATLQVLVTSTGEVIGTLRNNGGGGYSGTFTRPTNPQDITVHSSLGGSASRTVTVN
jgi:hypothetical protein